MARTPSRTLGALVDALALRLGYGAQAGAALPAAFQALCKQWLLEAQQRVWEEVGSQASPAMALIAMGEAQARYDFPDDCDPVDETIMVWARTTPVSVWYPLLRGLPAWVPDATDTQGGIPLRYERRDQITIWPVPDAGMAQGGGQLRVDYQPTLPRFTADTDRPGVPDRAVFLWALALGKAHKEWADAGVAKADADAEMRRLRVGAWRGDGCERLDGRGPSESARVRSLYQTPDGGWRS